MAKDEFLRHWLCDCGSAHILRSYYSANNKSDACPFGFGDEDVITECFRKREPAAE